MFIEGIIMNITEKCNQCFIVFKRAIIILLLVLQQLFIAHIVFITVVPLLLFRVKGILLPLV